MLLYSHQSHPFVWHSLYLYVSYVLPFFLVMFALPPYTCHPSLLKQLLERKVIISYLSLDKERLRGDLSSKVIPSEGQCWTWIWSAKPHMEATHYFLTFILPAGFLVWPLLSNNQLNRLDRLEKKTHAKSIMFNKVQGSVLELGQPQILT